MTISTVDIRTYTAKRQAEGASNASVNRDLIILKRMCMLIISAGSRRMSRRATVTPAVTHRRRKTRPGFRRFASRCKLGCQRAAVMICVPVKPARAIRSCASPARARDVKGPASSCCHPFVIRWRTARPSAVISAATAMARASVRKDATTISKSCDGPAPTSVAPVAAVTGGVGDGAPIGDSRVVATCCDAAGTDDEADGRPSGGAVVIDDNSGW
jgi:hypothetical protein